jgi:tetratricopeptide (TPR) repeat protein
VCMNLALAINPDLPQALISKGVTLGVIYEKYAEGLDLINSALEKNKSLPYHWPVVYYWKAKFLSNVGKSQEALNELDEGLRIAPANLYLLNLKAQLLSQQWKMDASYLSEAAEFFEMRIEINRGELQSIRELALIYHEQGLFDEFYDYALKLINSFAGLTHALRKDNIETMNISKEDLMSLINNIYLYCRYREVYPLNEYINYFESGFRSGLDYIFWTYFGLTFAKSCNMIKNNRDRGEDISWNDSSKQNESFLISILPLIIERICKNYHDCSKDERMNVMSEAIVNLPYIVLLETSREVGYLRGYHGASSDNIDYSTVSSNISAWYNSVIEIVISKTNTELKMLNEKDCEVFSKYLVDLDLI